MSLDFFNSFLLLLYGAKSIKPFRIYCKINFDFGVKVTQLFFSYVPYIMIIYKKLIKKG